MVEATSEGFGGLLKSLRLRQAMTQEQLAAAAGLSTNAVSSLERGVSKTGRKDTARLLADGLGLSGDERDGFLAQARTRNLGPRPRLGTATGTARTLPRDLTSFVGRHSELETLLGRISQSNRPGVVHTIGGMAGVGKTSLAVHLAHRLAPDYSDGQLFVSLNGNSPGQLPVDPSDALLATLLTVGHPAATIPSGLDARAAMWRSHLSSKRMLLVLDDALESDQVRPLLPGTESCLVLVTSRRQLTALEDASAISLETFSVEDAADLFVRQADRSDVVPSDPRVATITDLCGLLPLAVTIVARQWRAHSSWTIDDLVEDLTSTRERLASLAVENLSVSAAFDMSYQHLTSAEQHHFRRLGLHPGTTIDQNSAAALAGVSPAVARRLLGRLYSHHLLAEPAAGVYRLHDLLREHALSLTHSEPASEVDSARQRLLEHFVSTSLAANQFFARREPTAWPPQGAQRDETPSLKFDTREEALAWFTMERPNLHATAYWAARHGFTDHSIALAGAMAGYFKAQGFWDDARALHRMALDLAQGSGAHDAQLGALIDLGDMEWMTGNYALAKRGFSQAVEMAVSLGNSLREAEALKLLSFVQYETGENLDAITNLGRASERFEQLGHEVQLASALGSLAVIEHAIGNFGEAVANQERALQAQRALGDSEGQAKGLHFLGCVRHSLGDFEVALNLQQSALDLSREVGNRFGEANALNGKGSALYELGDLAGATAAQHDALIIYRELGHRMGEANVLHAQGLLLHSIGEHEAARASLTQALQNFSDLGIVQGQAEVLNTFGELASSTCDYSGAARHHRDALELATRAGVAFEEGRALEGLGSAELDLEEREEAEQHLARARAIFDRIDPHRAQRIESVLMSNSTG